MHIADVKISLTGNPFVDTGLAVMAALADLDNVQDLTVVAVQKLHGDGTQLASWNSRLKGFSQIFGTNNPLFQKGYGYQKGKGPSDLNFVIYRGTLRAFLDSISMVPGSQRCEACGDLAGFDFTQCCITAIKAGGRRAPEDKWLGRDWFPLSGSLGSDAQALPTASRSVYLCAKCLFAVHYLPLGVILLDGRLVVFQSTSVELWYELVRDIVNEIQSRIKGGNYDTLGAKEGSRAVARRLLGLFERLQTAHCLGDIPTGATLQVWRFTNSGSSPDCDIDEIPNAALVFLWRAVRHGLRQEVEGLINAEGKKERSLFRCINERRDYHGLYPHGKRPGASPKLFAIYQTDVCGRSLGVLATARDLARQATKGLKPQEIKRLQREEAFSDRSIRNQFRGLTARLAQEGMFTLDDYLDLFPMDEDDSGIAVRFDGWNIVRYYVHHLDDSEPLKGSSPTRPAFAPKLIMLRYYASCVFCNYVEERSKYRFQAEVLNRMARGEIRASWLKGQFLRLAEIYPGFTYGAWEGLCKSDRGQLFISELLFQLRLLWSEWIQTGELPTVKAHEFDHDSGLPAEVEGSLKAMFLQYVERRGLERFQRDVLVRLRRKEIDLAWFRRQLVHEREEPSVVKLFSQDEWEDFLKDEEGRYCSGERLFQIHLMLANLYRETK